MQYILLLIRINDVLFYLPILYRIDVDARNTRLFAPKALLSVVKLPSVRKSTLFIVEER